METLNVTDRLQKIIENLREAGEAVNVEIFVDQHGKYTAEILSALVTGKEVHPSNTEVVRKVSTARVLAAEFLHQHVLSMINLKNRLED